MTVSISSSIRKGMLCVVSLAWLMLSGCQSYRFSQKNADLPAQSEPEIESVEMSE